MKRNTLKLLCLLLSLIMVAGIFAACDTNPNDETSSGDVNESTTPGSENEDSSDSESISTEDSESESTSEQDSDTESESASETETEEETDETVHSIANIQNGPSIEYANGIANSVQMYYSANGSLATFKNSEMELSYPLKSSDSYTIQSIKNTQGKTYIENTADVFIRMTDGSTYYSSETNASPNTNITRMGYYYYDIQYSRQNFGGEINLVGEGHSVPFKDLKANQASSKSSNTEMKFVLNNIQDPYIYVNNLDLDTSVYNYAKITLKIEQNEVTTDSATCTVFIATSDHPYLEESTLKIPMYADGDYHTYLIPIGLVKNYSGNLKSIRLDFNSPLAAKDVIYISDFEVLPVDDEYMPLKASLNRKFFVYSDKMHHLMQFVASEETKNVAEVGMLTKIDASTVAKIMIKDANGEHSTLEGVDWASVEAVGFDIIEAGIFGYIMPNDAISGNINVTLADGYYVIEQTRAPANNSLIPSLPDTENANDFYLGQRIYTDENHDFEEFLHETYCERNPLTARNIKITASESTSSVFEGYDAARGIYKLKYIGKSSGWGVQFREKQNEHLNIKFAVMSNDVDRKIYVMGYTTREPIETGVLLNGSDMLLPIPLQVSKNFQEGTVNSNERNIYDLDDTTFSEAMFPLSIKANEKNSFNLISLSEYWGNYPLKQLCSLRFGHPYYHISTGVNESNCITPWDRSTLPDHRAMSSPFTHDVTQHTSGGTHYWLEYENSKGNIIYSDNINNVITSAGLTYTEIEMDYISKDGAIAATYTHMEFPNRDETRTFYTMEYTVLKDISFSDFKNQFEFYSLSDNHSDKGIYHEIGYLNTDNEYATAKAIVTGGGTQSFILGDECPYFSYYNMNGLYDPITNPTGYLPHDGNGYVNLSFLIYNYDFTINGEKVTPQFIIKEENHRIHLSLNLDSVTLKEGDTFTINAILLPWGSQELDGLYDTYKDKNVRQVRENTLLNPITATAVADCKVIESTYVPKVKSTNGKSAEFTISGGQENVAVRVYGYDMLTAPKLYEKLNGEWVAVDLYSANNPDKRGYAHYYDGYAVYYDGDGTFSYSFVIAMDNGAARTFKLEASEEFTKWPKIEQPNEDTPLNLYFGPADINVKLDMDRSNYTKAYVTFGLSEDNSYVSVYGTDAYCNDGKGEYYFQLGADSSLPAGQYIVIKYRVPESNAQNLAALMFYTSTKFNVNTGGASVTAYDPAFSTDGQWHVLVIDATSMNNPAKENLKDAFVPDEDGCYYPRHLRLNLFNQANVSADTRIDIAYVGMHDSMDDIKDLVSEDSEVKNIDFVDSAKIHSIIVVD